MLRTIPGYVAAALGLLLAVAACSNDDLFHPAGLTPIDPLFASYVSMGTTITAGWQSDGINDSTQVQSFAVLLARQMQTPFYAPLMNRPGCRPPIDNVFLINVNPGPTFGKPHRVGNTFDDTFCALRKTQPVPPSYINNVAVPGASVVDGLTNSGNPTPLTTFFLGGLTQFEALQRANPTFVTVELGVTDVLGAATDTIDAGDPTKITPVAIFTNAYDALLTALDGVPTIQGGILIGVPDVSGVPYFSYGYAYYVAYVTTQLPPTMTVDANCNLQTSGGVGDTVLVPFHYGFELIGQASAGASVTLDCLDAHNIEPDELANIHATVAAYNTVISDGATARGWPYVDPNVALAGLRADPAQVAPFPNFAATSCSGVGAAGSPFGLAFTCDGIHLSAATNKLVANGLIQVINFAYGTSLQAIP
jgi:hypothetical protein